MRSVSVVVPTLGRPSLGRLVAVLTAQAPAGTSPELIVVPDPARRGPAAARNTGWRVASGEWVVFLDDDVIPADDWLARLADDLDVPADVGGVQGVVEVPLPRDRRPTDWERGTAGLAHARWATADMAYRRAALVATGGFDERFPRAYREDAELAHRIEAAGWSLVRGRRAVSHPPRPEGPWASVRAQRGNADDALLRRLYGPQWRTLLELPAGRRGRHAAVTLAGVAALLGALAARLTRPRTRAVALAAAGLWCAGTAEFAWARIAPGPRTPGEVATMLATSVVIPPLAIAYWLLGTARARRWAR